MNNSTDLTGVEYARRARCNLNGPSDVYTGNDSRPRLIPSTLSDRVTDVDSMRALGFCVSVSHAQYTAQRFNENGISARVVHGSTPAHVR